MPGRPPDIAAFAELLSPIDVAGQARYIYSYIHELTGNEVAAFLEQLKDDPKGRCSQYVSAFRMVGMKGFARWEKWHDLDPKKPPDGILKTNTGQKSSLDGMGVFKNVPHQSRIYHCTEPGGLIVLLTVYTGKNEDDLTADAINPALRSREEYKRRKTQLIARRPVTK
ncbi:MAG: hypothetical protein ABSF35_06395 [Polyangia bacterium]